MKDLKTDLPDISYFLKEIHFINDSGKPVNGLVFDYWKIIDFARKRGIVMVTLISQRLMLGKTYNLKDYAIENWDGVNPILLVLRNLADDIRVEKRKFLAKAPPKLRENFKIEGDDIVDEKGNLFATFNSVSSPRTLRGSRIYIPILMLDEFNEGFKYLSSSWTDNLLNIMSSTDEMGESDKICFILGNNNTWNHPLFLDLGITGVKSDVTIINDEDYQGNQRPFMLILCGDVDEEQRQVIRKTNDKNATFRLANKTGKEKHIFYNESRFDDMNFIYPYYSDEFMIEWMMNHQEAVNLNDYLLPPDLTFKQNNQIFYIMKIPKFLKNRFGTTFHIINWTLHCRVNKIPFTPKPSNVSNKLNMEIGDIIVREEHLIKMRKLMSNSLVSFEDITAREEFINFLNKVSTKKPH